MPNPDFKADLQAKVRTDKYIQLEPVPGWVFSGSLF